MIPYLNEVGIFMFGIQIKKQVKLPEIRVLIGARRSTIEVLTATIHSRCSWVPYKRIWCKAIDSFSFRRKNWCLMVIMPESQLFIEVTDYSKLEAMMNEVCVQIPVFYFGRLISCIKHCRFRRRYFAIVELNVLQAVHHIYDLKIRFFAWKELFNITYSMLKINHKTEPLFNI
jgi:hypothetical protein